MVSKKRMKYALLIFVIFSIVFPATAYAAPFDWIGDAFIAGLTKLIISIFQPIFDGMFQALRLVMLTPTNLSSIPFISDCFQASQILAASLLLTLTVFKAYKYQVNGTTGGQVEPMASILSRAGMSGILIFGLPWILESVLLPANDALMNYVQGLGVKLDSSMALIMTTSAGMSLVSALFFMIFVVAMLGLLISNTIRIAELIFLYIAAPILAVSHAGKGESLQIWIMQAVALSFTQVVQYVLVGVAFNLLGSATTEWWTLLGAIGSVVVAIRGPQLLKQFLYSSGVGGAATGVGQQMVGTAIYKVMMK
jgi:hypothetical protein